MAKVSAAADVRRRLSDLKFSELLETEPQEGRLFFNHRRAAIFDIGALGKLREQLLSSVGEEMTMGVLSRFGYAQGYGDAAVLGAGAPWESEKEWLAAGPFLHTLEGLVHVTVEKIEFDRKTGFFEMGCIWKNSFEVEAHPQKFEAAPRPVCWTLTGYASGYATRFFGRPILAIETECVKKGDPRCYVVLRPVDAWGDEAKPSLQALKAVDIANQLTELKRSVSIFQDLVLGADWTWETDTQGRYTYCSEQFQKYLGYAQHEVLGKHLFEFAPKADFERLKTRTQNISDLEETVRDLRVHFLDKQGRTVAVQIRGVPFLDDPKRTVCFRGIVRNVTAQDVAEKSLEAKTEELERFFYLSIDLFCIADVEGYFQRLNPAWETILGYSITELKSKRLFEFVHPDDCESTVNAMGELASGKPVINFVNRYRHRNGSYRWFEWRAAPVNRLVYAVARDITFRIEIEKDLEKAKDSAESAARVKSQFLDIAAHELKTPLTAMSLLTQRMERQSQAGSSIALDGLSRIRANTNRLVSLVNDLLDVSRLERGTVTLRPIEQDLALLVAASVEEFKQQAPRRQFRLSGAEQPIVARFDPVRIQQVVANLIDNAIKYSAADTPIDIELMVSTGTVKMTVTNQGPEIPLDVQNSLFTRFFRVESEATRYHPGLGLGLYICRSIINLHRGTIGVSSDVKHGTSFYFTLPIQ